MERAGISLRKKRSVRPKISAPQQISAPQPISAPIANNLPPPPEEGLLPPPRPRLEPNGSSGSVNTLRERPQTRENTADYVKRRYSTHLNKLPKDFADAPAVPSIPGQYSQSGTSSPGRPSRPPGGHQKIDVDLKALEDPHLRPDQYVAQILANATEQEIRDYQNDLTRVKHRTSTDIQHSVYQNRSQFIKISQEAEKLKGEMRALRNLMSDLTTTLGQTNASLGITPDAPASRKYANRSSVANLEAMWSTHLQELWRRVEGSQKYLPAIPGRHIVHESSRWVELNTATWKPRRRVHIILLNDNLLVATEKNRPDQPSQAPDVRKQIPNSASTQQLVADRCFPLLDIEINDLTTKAEPTPAAPQSGQAPVSHAINIRIGSESFTYATTDKSNSEKATFLSKFRKALTDLRKAVQLDSDERPNGQDGHQRSLSTNLRDSMVSNGAGTAPESASNKAAMLVEVDGRQQNFRWVENQVDELDIDIALQRFAEAVERIEQLRRIAKNNKRNVAIQELVDGKVQDRVGKLGRAIIRQMTETHSFITATQQNVQWLNNLGLEVRASEAYLEARSAVIRTRTAQCTDEGSLHHYLYQISFIYFTLIRNTISIFQACFVPAMASACIKWAKSHVEEFNVVLAQQLGKLEEGSEERSICLDTAREHAKLLQDVGVDFRNIVGKGL